MCITATRSARFSLLQVELPSQGLINAGVVLEDPSTDRAYLRMRRDWAALDPGEADVLGEMESDLESKFQEMGAAECLEYLCNTLSNTLRITDPKDVIVADFDRGLARLYREHVQSTVAPFQTTSRVIRWPWRQANFSKTKKSAKKAGKKLPPGCAWMTGCSWPALWVVRWSQKSPTAACAYFARA